MCHVHDIETIGVRYDWEQPPRCRPSLGRSAPSPGNRSRMYAVFFNKLFRSVAEFPDRRSTVSTPDQ